MDCVSLTSKVNFMAGNSKASFSILTRSSKRAMPSALTRKARQPFVLTFYWLKLPQPIQEWWHSKKQKLTLEPMVSFPQIDKTRLDMLRDRWQI